MAGERQVLFRLDEELLERLDEQIQRQGYKTRNAWFRSVVEETVRREAE